MLYQQRVFTLLTSLLALTGLICAQSNSTHSAGDVCEGNVNYCDESDPFHATILNWYVELPMYFHNTPHDLSNDKDLIVKSTNYPCSYSSIQANLDLQSH